MAAKLKTYWAEIDGLHEWIVAAPNQRAALDAFGINQDLFAQDEAGIETDPDKSDAAAARPGVPLRRMKGSKEDFKPAGGGADWTAVLEAIPKSKPKPPSRKAIERAEAALADFQDRGVAQVERLEAEQAALARKLTETRAALKDERKALEAALAKARDDYVKAGGRL